MPTTTLEEYLETIYKLSRNGTVRPTQIAESMGVSGPTVTATLRRLETRGLVSRTGTAVELTAEGMSQSLDVVRKHRIAERFLVDVLGLDWEAAHEDACLLEHAMSSRMLEALERYLNNPEVCPHGHPIPSAQGVLAEPSGQSLSDAPAGESYTVLRVAEDEDVLGYLGKRGLRPGASVTIRDRDAVGGILTLEVDGALEVLSLDIGRHVTVAER
ncbi:MAG TPA: metal-dependent transcriptional regulator [Coriobacteriia bacterium]|nr:metal-dependent transcriptional regulator [Coriobacteriia bacterium]